MGSTKVCGKIKVPEFIETIRTLNLKAFQDFLEKQK